MQGVTSGFDNTSAHQNTSECVCERLVPVRAGKCCRIGTHRNRASMHDIGGNILVTVMFLVMGPLGAATAMTFINAARNRRRGTQTHATHYRARAHRFART